MDSNTPPIVLLSSAKSDSPSAPYLPSPASTGGGISPPLPLTHLKEKPDHEAIFKRFLEGKASLYDLKNTHDLKEDATIDYKDKNDMRRRWVAKSTMETEKCFRIKPLKDRITFQTTTTKTDLDKTSGIMMEDTEIVICIRKIHKNKIRKDKII